MGLAGQSAREEYKRRREADLQRRRRHFKWNLAVIVLVPTLLFAVLRPMTTQLVGEGAGNLLAGVFAFLVGANLALKVWGFKGPTEAWRKGAEGEEMTARTLAKLPPGFVSLHDLRLPGSRANIDHLVIGPTGVFTVETKHYSSDIEVKRGKARCAGRSLAKVVDQAAGQALAAIDVLGFHVRPIVCVQGAAVTAPLFSRPLAGKVRFCSDRRLNKVITTANGALSSDEVRRLVGLAEGGF